MKRKTKLILIISGSVLLLLISGIFIYLNVYYKAVDVDNYLKSSDTVKVEEIKEGYMFDSASDKALIFYPGAKVDTKAYAPLCFQMAEKGFDVLLLDMPFHFAIFDMNAANDIIKNYQGDLGGGDIKRLPVAGPLDILKKVKYEILFIILNLRFDLLK